MNFSLDTHCILEDQARGPATPVLGLEFGCTDQCWKSWVSGRACATCHREFTLFYYIKKKRYSYSTLVVICASPVGSHAAAKQSFLLRTR